MRTPFEVGWRPERSRSTPALASSSLYFVISAMSVSLGMTPASLSWLALTIIMNRIAGSPSGFRDRGSDPALSRTTNGMVRDRHAPQRSRAGKNLRRSRPTLDARGGAANGDQRLQLGDPK